MPEPDGEGHRPEAALAAERQFVTTLGGMVLGIAGAELVTHERIPIPSFNFVQVGGVDRGRQAAFFERALDHYFQRALRPTFRLPVPAAEHLVEGLERFGFRPEPEPLVLLIGAPDRPRTEPSGVEVRPGRDEELDEVATLLAGPEGRVEFRAALDIAWHHSNPGEQVTPIVATRGDRIVSAAVRYEREQTVGLHLVTTQVDDRGQGAATALVGGALGPSREPARAIPFLFADSARLERRLRSLGFAPVRAFREFCLPDDVELAFPPPGPPTPPRWRPPRGGAARRSA